MVAPPIVKGSSGQSWNTTFDGMSERWIGNSGGDR